MLALSPLEVRRRDKFPLLRRWAGLSPLPFLLLLAVVLAGAGRMAAAHRPAGPGDAAWYHGRGEVQLTGWIAAMPEPGSSPTALHIQAQELVLPAEGSTPAETIRVRGGVLVRLPAQGLQYGDRLTLRGLLAEPPALGDFSYREALARQGVGSLLLEPAEVTRLAGPQPGTGLLAAVYRLRLRAYALINQLFPQPEAALLNGILLGLDRDLPGPLAEAFKVTGTAHIIAISGFNISLLSGLFYALFRRLFPRWGAMLGAVLATTAYTLLVGAEPPVARAAVMGALVLFGREIGRPSAGLNSLGFAAALMCLPNPDLPWDPSFQLSFGATLGLILYAGPLQRGFARLAARWFGEPAARRIAGPVGEYLLVTLAAQLTTFPLMAAHFGRLSLITLLANPLVLPPQPLVMILGGLAVIAGLVWQPLGQGLAYLAWPGTVYTVRLVSWLGSLPGAGVEIREFGLLQTLGYYAVLLLLPRLRVRKLVRPALLLGGAGLAAVLAWSLAAGRPDGRLHMLITGGAGQSILLRGPGGAAVLINPGQTGAVRARLDRQLPLFARRLDALILAGAPPFSAAALDQLSAGLALDSAAAARGFWQASRGAALEDALLAQQAAPLNLEAGGSLLLGSGARLDVLAVEGQEAALLLEWGDFRALLPGQIAPDHLAAWAGRLAPLTLLVIGGKPDLPAWADFQAQQVVLLNAPPPEVSPLGALSLAGGGSLQALTDGRAAWMTLLRE